MYSVCIAFKDTYIRDVLKNSTVGVLRVKGKIKKEQKLAKSYFNDNVPQTGDI